MRRTVAPSARAVALAEAVAARAAPIYANRDVRSLTRPVLVLAIALGVVVLPTAATGALSGANAPLGPAANSVTYQDSVGEDPAAPDITTIVASNDDAGMMSFRISIPNRPQYSRDIALVMFLDSDANQATGDQESLGADHVIQLLLGEIILFKWDGTDYTVSATQSSLSYEWASGVTVRINAADLSNTRRLNFDVVVVSGLVIDETTGAIDATNAKRDFAPAIGFYTYDVRITPPTLEVRRLTATPRNPVAGRPFTLRLVAARSDTGAVVQNGRVTCVGRVGTARLRATVQRVVGGAATCTWNIPPKAKGKAFRGSVAVTFEGLKAQQGYSSRVR